MFWLQNSFSINPLLILKWKFRLAPFMIQSWIFVTIMSIKNIRCFFQKSSPSTFGPLWLRCNLPQFRWFGLIFFEWFIKFSFLSLHISVRCAFTSYSFPANTQRWFNVDICSNNVATSVNVISTLIQRRFVNVDSSIKFNVETTLILGWL